MPLDFHIDSETFKGLFPFHIAFDRHLRIKSLGQSLQKICPDVSENDNWQDTFAISYPLGVELSFNAISQQLNTIFILRPMKMGVELNGQIIIDRKNELLIFLCSPVIKHINEINTMGLKLGDFAKHDQMCNYIFMLQAYQRTLDELNESLENLSRTNKALIESEAKYLQAQKMEAIGTLVGGIAHDFNNMLAGMTGNLYLAKKRVQDNPYVMQKLANIERLSFRAADMIKKLLTFARKDQVNMQALPFNPFIKETLKFLRRSVPENIDMHQEICSEALQINGDSTQIHQCLMNLINNARDAVDNPCITIRLEAFHTDDAFIESHPYFTDGAYAHLSVGDNGCGISKAQIIHMFEPFFTTKEQGKGTGLGLAMVFGAIKTHKGFVEVKSTEGEGATFHIYIPLLESKDVDTVSPQEEKTINEGHGETILLVDDEQNILDTGKEVLESLGYQVLGASNGLEAVDIFITNQDKIALIITDIVMPKLGGIKAIERIRKIRPDIKVIFSTGYDMGTALEDLVPSSENAILFKPYNIEDLSKTIRDQLDS